MYRDTRHPGAFALINRKRIVSLLALALSCASLLLGFQNCGQFTALGSNALSSSSELDSTPLVDGLAAGLAQPGKIFVRDPGSAVGNSSLDPAGDLTSSASAKTILHLLNKSYLSDGFIELSSDDAFPGVFAQPSASLEFATSDSRFDQVNVYYALDTFIADLKGRSLFPANYPILKINTHCTESGAANNAFYSFDEHRMCLGYSDLQSGKRVWSAQDSDVVVHEFGHSLNHKFSTSEIMTSTSDNGAMDEGFADLWAYRQYQSPYIASWFGRSLYLSAYGYAPSPFTGLRNLDSVKSYPSAVAYEVHDDSLFLSGAVKEIEKNSGMSVGTMARFEKRLVESIQYGGGLVDVIRAVQDNAASFGVASPTVSAALNSRGLLRKDLASEVVLDSTRPAYVIDNHKYTSYQVGGNCNSSLDAGETVLLMPNIRNTGAVKGSVQVSVTSSTAGVQIVTGGEVGSFARLPANATFVASDLAAKTKGSADYLNRFLPGVFVVKIPSGASGNAHFDITIKTMNTLDTAAQTVARSLDLPIGAVATMSSSCGTSAEASVWP